MVSLPNIFTPDDFEEKRRRLLNWYFMDLGVFADAAAYWNFAGNKDLTGGDGPTLTFTRASDGTYFDSAGILQTAGTNQPRFDHQPDTNKSLGLLIEESRANSHRFSEDASSWTNTSNNTVTSNVATAPDGNQTADSILHLTGGNPYQDETITAGESIVKSHFVKPNGGRWVMLIETNTGFVDGFQCWFDLQNGVVGSSQALGVGTFSKHEIKALSNGWFWIWAAGTLGGTHTTSRSMIRNAVTDNSGTRDETNTNYWWGADLERGVTFPTSYIPTTTTAVTRAADVCSTADVTWFNETTGTFYTRADTADVESELPWVFLVDDGSAVDRHALRFRSFGGGDTKTNALGTASSVTQWNIDSNVTFTANERVKFGYSYILNNITIVQGGTIGENDPLATLPTGLTTFRVGSRSGIGTGWLNGHIAEIAYWGTLKSNAFLQSLTS